MRLCRTPSHFADGFAGRFDYCIRSLELNYHRHEHRKPLICKLTSAIAGLAGTPIDFDAGMLGHAALTC